MKKKNKKQLAAAPIYIGYEFVAVGLPDDRVPDNKKLFNILELKFSDSNKKQLLSWKKIYKCQTWVAAQDIMHRLENKLPININQYKTTTNASTGNNAAESC